jgi:ribonuclease BN (tRNA processing enzyme)
MRDMFRGHDVATGLIYQDANIKVTAAENTHFHLSPANPAYGKYKSYSFRFETPDKVVVFTGDTGPSQSVEELAKGADMLVSEVLVVDDFVEALKKNGTWDAMSTERQVGRVRHLSEDHLTPMEVGKLASRAEPGGQRRPARLGATSKGAMWKSCVAINRFPTIVCRSWQRT